MDIKDALTLMIGFGVFLIALLTLIINLIVAISNKRK